MITLRQLIKEKGFTNKIVTDALGVSPTNIGRYDDLSKRSIEEIKIIADTLNVDISDLLGVAVNNIEEKKCETNQNQDSTNSIENRLLSIIESQQRTIEALANNNNK